LEDLEKRVVRDARREIRFWNASRLKEGDFEWDFLLEEEDMSGISCFGDGAWEVGTRTGDGAVYKVP
jgi:hypothetical protein